MYLDKSGLIDKIPMSVSIIRIPPFILKNSSHDFDPRANVRRRCSEEQTYNQQNDCCVCVVVVVVVETNSVQIVS